MQAKEGGTGSFGVFTLEEGLEGFLFVLKQNENSWLNCMGNDFYVPFPSPTISTGLPKQGQTEGAETPGIPAEENEISSHSAYTGGIISEIRNLMSDISSEKSGKTKSKEAQESILQEIEKLAAEAYNIFRSSVPTFLERAVSESEELKPPVQIPSAIGSGFEILCQGFNWESHKSGRWYLELKGKARELSALGFTVIWLPPPTDSVSHEGYMPTDYYNLNSRYRKMSFMPRVILYSSFHATE